MTFSPDTIQKAWERQSGLCAACGKRISRPNRTKGTHGSWQPHHRKPRKDGGSDFLRNCVLLCFKCHLKVGHKGDFHNRVQLTDRDLPHMYEGRDPYHLWYND
ncbi:HNH endonuclease [Chloroflexota bacterium]